MWALVQSQVHIAGVEFKALLRLAFELNFITCSHAFLDFKMQVSGFEHDLFTVANWAFVSACMSTAITLFTLHFNFFDLVFNLDFSEHFATTTACLALVQRASSIACTFAVFANLSSSEAIHSLASSVESGQWNGHVSSEVASFGFGSFLDF